jgi:hypothetical protein
MGVPNTSNVSTGSRLPADAVCSSQSTVQEKPVGVMLVGTETEKP